MKSIFTLVMFYMLSMQFANAQDYPVGTQSITFTDASRSSRQILTNVYYPALSAGAGTAIAPGSQAFPVVVFGHGFVIPPTAYEWLADSLVKRGYIVAFPTTGGELFPSHTDFGNDLLFLCNYITSLNDSASSFLYHGVIKKAAVAGHSMGGGCSFLAAANTSPAISALFNFAAAETNPSAITAALSVNKPTLIFSGSSDCIVPASTQQQMYANIPASCKTYINITGAIHCQYANNNGTCVLGQALSGCNSSPITPAIVFDKVTTLLIPFLDYYLKDSCTRGTDYLNAYNTLSGADKTISCNTIAQCGVLPISLQSFTAVLQNKTVGLNWTVSAGSNLDYFITEKSGDGISFQPFDKIGSSKSPAGSATYQATDKNPYPKISFYRLKFFNKDGSYSTSGIIKVNTPSIKLVVISALPNPVKDNVQIELAGDKNQQVLMQIYNTSGQLTMKQSLTVNAGSNKKNLSLTGLATGMYVIIFRGNDGEILSMLKVQKD